MNKNYSSIGITLRIWLLTCTILTIGFTLYLICFESISFIIVSVVFFIVAMAGSFPVAIILRFSILMINRKPLKWQEKFWRLLFIQFLITLFYGSIGALLNFPFGMIFNGGGHFAYQTILISALLFACSAGSSFILLKIITSYFSYNQTSSFSYNQLFTSLFQHTSKNNTNMETFNQEQHSSENPSRFYSAPQSQSNKLLIKGIVTGVLILMMLIPTFFINSIITEREQRQKEVVKEVSSKWATSQTISGPYLVVPYNDTSLTSDGKIILTKRQIILLANELDVNGKIIPEERPRSIYKVLLYKSNIKLSGIFKPSWPVNINAADFDLAKAKLCFGISDFKGIEEEIRVNFNKQILAFTPGLPINDLGEVGLSVPVSLTSEMLHAGVPFDMQVKLKGSEQLHFMPLAANSRFNINSSWPNPSFDGNSLPNERNVKDSGFSAKWNFNQANLPFGTVVKQGDIKATNLDFGVSLVQPADQYNKTMRSVKYAILFIGLTFALFFIIEIMQRKPFHPVQYVLVGLALVIFYTLLLAISEYILFDQAYLIAAVATVTLISLYAKSHFTSWKMALVFFSTLSLLYGFIFVLIRLEDTALLVGSIGLFIVLALVMYASRKINWYGEKVVNV